MKHTSKRRTHLRNGHRSDENIKPQIIRQARNPSPVERLHRQIGNQAVQELHNQGKLQTQLRVSSPNDSAEKEAEKVAKAVMQRNYEENTNGMNGNPRERNVDSVQTIPDHRSSGGGVDEDIELAVLSGRQGSGKPLRTDTRADFETSTGADFSDVRIHQGRQAANMASVLGARAFTIGNHIGFANGMYCPESTRGKRLLAHELTHVLQGQAGRSSELRIFRQAIRGLWPLAENNNVLEMPEIDLAASKDRERWNRRISLLDRWITAVYSHLGARLLEVGIAYSRAYSNVEKTLKAYAARLQAERELIVGMITGTVTGFLNPVIGRAVLGLTSKRQSYLTDAITELGKTATAAGVGAIGERVEGSGSEAGAKIPDSSHSAPSSDSGTDRIDIPPDIDFSLEDPEEWKNALDLSIKREESTLRSYLLDLEMGYPPDDEMFDPYGDTLPRLQDRGLVLSDLEKEAHVGSLARSMEIQLWQEYAKSEGITIAEVTRRRQGHTFTFTRRSPWEVVARLRKLGFDDRDLTQWEGVEFRRDISPFLEEAEERRQRRGRFRSGSK